MLNDANNIIEMKKNKKLSSKHDSSLNKDNNKNDTNNKQAKNKEQLSNNYKNKSWLEIQKLSRQKALDQAQSIMQDRVILETEETNATYTIDAK